MSETQFDLIVIGGGPGGYVCAIKAAQLGMKVACVESRGSLGGTCLNVGCIPSKALLHSSHLYELASHEMASHGIQTGELSVDLAKMIGNKDKVVRQLTQGIEFLFKKNKIAYKKGHGKILKNDTVQVALNEGGSEELKTRNIVIATGSKSTPLPGTDIDEKRIVTSTGALEFDAIPEHLLIVGAGYIGLEMGTVWQRLGSKVTVVEYLDRITPGMDGEISKQFQRILKKQGMEFKLGYKVNNVEKDGEHLNVAVEPAKGGAGETISCDRVLVSIGRIPFTENLGLENVQIVPDKRGMIEIDDHFKTSADNIYAIGDVVRGPMLAHKAEEEGVFVAEMLTGQKPHLNYDAIPGVVYTEPEVASIGKTEEQLKEAGVSYQIGKFPFSANSRAKATGKTEGFVKILADAKTDQVLGCHIIGAEAGTLIAEIGIAMEFGASSEDIARTCHAHPTLEEAVKEAALDAFAKPIHM